MLKELETLRQLAKEFSEAANAPRNEERKKLHRASNDLHMIRPVVQIDELPWNEMTLGSELTPVCTDPLLRETEMYLRKKLFQFRNFPADMILKPYLPVAKCIEHSSIGVGVLEETVSTNDRNHIISHEYEDQFAEDDSIAKLQDVRVSYNKEETIRRYEVLGSALGDILPIKLTGIDYVSVVTWDDIARYRGVTPLLMDLVERPEFCHALVNRLTEIREGEIAQYEALDLFENDPDSLHCTPILTEDLPKAEPGKTMTRKNVWGRGTAQIFASVSKAMHEEFDINYMKRTIGTCGLSYYGCCEPLDKKMDIVEKIPNLRKVSITPWANVDIAAEAIGKKYVLASKPNPASVAVAALDKDELKREMSRILQACKRNSCSVDITLKDISTCGFRPANIFEWEKIVMDMVQNY
ncbi:MAG: hypothetical protein RSC76_07260 [Oscillospiraceae bacterium]